MEVGYGLEWEGGGTRGGNCHGGLIDEKNMQGKLEKKNH